MNVYNEVQRWLETWAPHCGAPRKVFVGQFEVLMRNVLNEIENREGSSIEAVDEIRKELLL